MLRKDSSLMEEFLKKSQQGTAAVDVRMVDVHQLVPNEHNLYGMRDIEELADMIEMSHIVEPLRAYRDMAGKLILTSGHRRREAVLHLLARGSDISPLVPVVITAIGEETDTSIPAEYRLTAEEVEKSQIILLNKHRKMLPSEIAEEMAQMLPILQKKYLASAAAGERGHFRSFRSAYWGVPESTLRRLEAVVKLPQALKDRLDSGEIPLSIIPKLVNMPSADAIAVVEELETAGEEMTMRAIEEKIRARSKSRVPALEMTSPDADAEKNPAGSCADDATTGIDGADDKPEEVPSTRQYAPQKEVAKTGTAPHEKAETTHKAPSSKATADDSLAIGDTDIPPIKLPVQRAVKEFITNTKFYLDYLAESATEAALLDETHLKEIVDGLKKSLKILAQKIEGDGHEAQ